MSDFFALSEWNVEELKAHIAWFSESTQLRLKATQEAVGEILKNENEKIRFLHLIQQIDALFVTHPTAFTNGNVFNEAGKNLSSLKVLTLALLMWLNTDQALRLFWEHWEEVSQNPDWDTHSNIRNLDEVGIQWVKIYGIVFDERI